MRTLRALSAIVALALATPAYADFQFTQGTGPIAFDFTCFVSKHCFATVVTNSAGTEIFTSGNPAQVTGANGTFPVTQPTAANLNATVVQPTAANLNATVVGTLTVNQGTASANNWATNVQAMGGTSIAAGCVGALNSFGTSIPATTCGVFGTYVINALAPGSATYSASSPVTAATINVTPTDCSLAITTGGTAQNILAASSTLHGFTIKNIDAAAGGGEPVWISFTTTAAATTIASYPLGPPASTTFLGGESYTTPLGYGVNHAISVVAATTGHKISCTTW